MVKLFVHNKPLFLIDKINDTIADYLQRPETIFLEEFSSPAVKTILQQLKNDEYYTGVFLHHDLHALLESFKSQFTTIVAAGGLVYTKKKELLLIFRKGKWDLPKGKLDDGEELEACALREIEEETGAKDLRITQPLQITYHTYVEKGKQILKESHWYLIASEKKSKLTAQAEEDIQQCIWVPHKEVETYFDKTHASVVDVLKKGLQLLG